jgi:hypothetical protein
MISEELFDFGNLIRSSAADPGDATLMRAFEQLRSENADALLTMCNMFHGTPLDMAVDWKRDALVDALVPLYVAAIDVSIDDDDDDLEEYHHASGRDYDSDPACHLLDALRSAAELGRVDSVRAIVAALESANVTLARLERRAPPGSEPVLVNAVRGFDRSHEYPELLTDCADHGPYDSCEFDAATQRSRPPSEHSPATSLAIVELLVRGGVDLHAANEMERMCTGFCAALEVGELAIARALLAHDAAVAHTARMHEAVARCRQRSTATVSSVCVSSSKRATSPPRWQMQAPGVRRFGRICANKSTQATQHRQPSDRARGERKKRAPIGDRVGHQSRRMTDWTTAQVVDHFRANDLPQFAALCQGKSRSRPVSDAPACFCQFFNTFFFFFFFLWTVSARREWRRRVIDERTRCGAPDANQPASHHVRTGEQQQRSRRQRHQCEYCQCRDASGESNDGWR